MPSVVELARSFTSEPLRRARWHVLCGDDGLREGGDEMERGWQSWVSEFQLVPPRSARKKGLRASTSQRRERQSREARLSVHLRIVVVDGRHSSITVNVRDEQHVCDAAAAGNHVPTHLCWLSSPAKHARPRRAAAHALLCSLGQADPGERRCTRRQQLQPRDSSCECGPV